MRETAGNGEKCEFCGFSLKSEPQNTHALRPYTILQGKYLVGNVIGEGGFGITYIGLDLNLEIRTAIKEFYPNGFVTRDSGITSKISSYTTGGPAPYEKWKESFVKEARRLARFSELQGIVHVRDFFQENNTAYIVMEYVEGTTLKDYLKEKGERLSADETLSLMRPVIRSLAKVHEAGIVHRDISPDNIMIQRSGGLKLIDFGAARDFGIEGDKSLSVLLKPGYAPEEQYRSKGKQGPWTDVYALSATIYRCITGEKPVESMERMREDKLRPVSEFGIKLPKKTEEALMAGMAVYAENRIQTMNELEERLYEEAVTQGSFGFSYTDVRKTEKAETLTRAEGSKDHDGAQNPASPETVSEKEARGASKWYKKRALYFAVAGIAAVFIIVLTVHALSGSSSPASGDQVVVTPVPSSSPSDLTAPEPLSTGEPVMQEPTEKPVPEATAAPTEVTEAEPTTEPGKNTASISELYRDVVFQYVFSKGYVLKRLEFTEMNSDGIPEMLMFYKNNEGDEYYKESVFGIRDGYAIRIFHTEVTKYNLNIARNNEEAVTFIKNKSNARYKINNNGYELFSLEKNEDPFLGQLYSLSEHFTANDRDYMPDSYYPWMMVINSYELENAIDTLRAGMAKDDKHEGIACSFSSDMSMNEFEDEWRAVLSRSGEEGLNGVVEIWKPTKKQRQKYIGKLFVIYQCVDGVRLHNSPDLEESSVLYPVGAGFDGNVNGDEFFVNEKVDNSDPESAVKYLYRLDNGAYITGSEMSVAFIPFE